MNGLNRAILETFTHCVGDVRIDGDEEQGFDVYYPIDRRHPLDHCDSIESLNGYLWGCVVGSQSAEFAGARNAS